MNSFQLTFRHLVDANNVLAEPPPLHPASSSIPPTSSCSSGPTPASSSSSGPTPASSSSSGPTPASSSSSGPLEFITSERGKPKLIHDGYHYTYHQTNKRKESYTLVFSKIKSWIDVVSQNWQLEAHLSDFEKGPFLAAVEVFPGIAKTSFLIKASKKLLSPKSNFFWRPKSKICHE